MCFLRHVWRKRQPSRHETAPETAEKPPLTCVAKKGDESAQLVAMIVGVVGRGVTIFVTENMEAMLLFLF